MSTTEETSLIVETTIIETVEEVTQMTEYSSEVVAEEKPTKTIEENVPDNRTKTEPTEAPLSTDTENQSQSEKVDPIEKTNLSPEESSSTIVPTEVDESVKQPPTEAQEIISTEETEKSDSIESKDVKLVELNEKHASIDGVEEGQDKKISDQEMENSEPNPAENDESGASGESKDVNEEATDERSDEVKDTPMEVDQNGDKAVAETKPEQVEISEDEAPEEGVYIVEGVVAHRKRTGKIQYFLKWKGYPDTDNTWEDEDNLFCTELIEEYWKTKKNDTPVKTPVKRNRPIKRKSEEVEEIPEKKQKEIREDIIDEDNWENEVKEVETVEQTKDQLMIYLLWNNGKRSVHPSDEVNKKCPQKVIRFYESHLSFKSS